ARRDLVRDPEGPPMNRYLDIIRSSDQSAKSDRRGALVASVASVATAQPNKIPTRQHAYSAALATLEARVPERVDRVDWEQAVADAKRFLVQWGEQAEALGWTARDLFGLHEVPDRPPPTYRRLSRYDETGLVWLLRGREVVALTETTAAIRGASGSILTYRKLNKPALGPVGDSLDDGNLGHCRAVPAGRWSDLP